MSREAGCIGRERVPWDTNDVVCTQIHIRSYTDQQQQVGMEIVVLRRRRAAGCTALPSWAILVGLAVAGGLAGWLAARWGGGRRRGLFPSTLVQAAEKGKRGAGGCPEIGSATVLQTMAVPEES